MGFHDSRFEDQHIDRSNRRGKIGRVSGSIYTLNGYNLITKVDVKNLRFIQDDKRIVIYDSRNEVIMDTSLDDIFDWKIKKYSDDMDEHVFCVKDKGFYCKMLVSGYEEESQ